MVFRLLLVEIGPLVQKRPKIPTVPVLFCLLLVEIVFLTLLQMMVKEQKERKTLKEIFCLLLVEIEFVALWKE